MGLRELAIESLPGSVSHLAFTSPDGPAYLRTVATESVCFKFGDRLSDQGIYQFGLELLKHNAFSLPADVTWFEYRPVPDQTVGILLVADPVPDADLMAMAFCADSMLKNPRPSDVTATANIYHLKTGAWEIPDLRSPAHERFGASFRSNSELMMADVIFLVALLNSKGLNKAIVPANAKLNKARLKAGKPAIADVVHISVPGGYAYGTEGDAIALRNSPRPHFRRGHVRRLEQKLVMVRPTWVLGGDAPKQYIVDPTPS